MSTITILASEGMRKAIGLIKRAAKRGVTIPGLAEAMKLPQSSVDNYVRRLEAFGAVRKTQGKMPKDGTGRPPMVWTWAGRPVVIVDLTPSPPRNKPKAAAKSKPRKAAKRKAARKASKPAKRKATKTRRKTTAKRKAAPAAAPASA